jgi:carboxyl-terminal processing protease
MRTYKIITSLCLTLTFCFSTYQTKAQDVVVEAQKFGRLVDYIDKMYVDSVDVHKLVEKAIISMLEELDPHSVYISKEEYDDMNAPLVGSFSGVGIRFQILKDTIMVVETISGGPSEKVGLMAGDKIVEIEGINVAGVSIKNSDVRSKLLGDKGTKVNVKIARKNTPEPIAFTITRADIPIYSVDAYHMVAPKIGYIKINNFSRTTNDEVKKAIKQLEQEGMKDLIIDLQGNGGGYLSTAIELSDEVLSGDKLIVYTEGVNSPRRDYKAGSKGMFEKGRLIVLVDESSASASEIFSGAVQDWDRGLIVGRRSFGKGLVQNQLRLTDGSWVRLTTSRYFTPTGRSIQKAYTNGTEEYKMEKFTRYETGEAFHIDSIKIADSLKYETLIKKRTVYGGGGIIPDVFVAIDTTMSSDYSIELIRKGITNQFALTYVNENREMLKQNYPDFKSFKQNFNIDDAIKQMIAYAEKEGLPYSDADYQKSKLVIDTRLKAIIAQNLYETNKFYEIITPLNETLIKAIELLQNDEYNKMDLSKN